MQNDILEMDDFGVVRARYTEGQDQSTPRGNKRRCILRKRYIVTIMTMAAVFLSQSLEGNLPLVIEIITTDMNVVIDNETYTSKAEFNWTSQQQNTVLNSFSWGYMFSPLGGYLSTKVGGADLYGIVIATSGVLTIVTPLIVHFGIPLFICTRFLLGLLIGISASASTDIFVHWAPPKERSRLTVSLCIAAYGNFAVNDLICNFITSAFSWEVLFFQTGTICLIWYFIWFMLISNDPSKDACISRAERIYLKEVIAYPQDEVMYPWRRIFTSSSMWAFINSRLVDACSFSFLVHHVSAYAKDTFDVTTIGETILSTITNLIVVLVFIFGAIFADSWRCKKFGPSKVHQFYIGLSHCCAIILLIYIVLRKVYAETLICLFLLRLCYCIANVSYFTYSIDMASQYASFTMGLSNSFVAFGLLLNNFMVDILVPNHTRAEWNIYIIALVVLHIWAAILFYIFGSGYPQSWTTLSRQKAIGHHSSTNQHSALVG